MRRFTIFILLLSFCHLAVAQQLQRFAGEKLEYALTWNLFPFITSGKVCLECQQIEGGFKLSFHGFTIGLAKKFNDFDNQSTVYIDSCDKVQGIIHKLSDKTEDSWQMNYAENLIYHFFEGNKLDSFKIDDFTPGNVLSAIYLLRDSQLKPGLVIPLYIIGSDSSKRSCWKPVSIKVIGKEIWEGTSCWVLKISLDPKDNIFPGGNIVMRVTADNRLTPIWVRSDLHLFGIIPTLVEGRLIDLPKKDD